MHKSLHVFTWAFLAISSAQIILRAGNTQAIGREPSTIGPATSSERFIYPTELIWWSKYYIINKYYFNGKNAFFNIHTLPSGIIDTAEHARLKTYQSQSLDHNFFVHTNVVKLENINSLRKKRAQHDFVDLNVWFEYLYLCKCFPKLDEVFNVYHTFLHISHLIWDRPIF